MAEASRHGLGSVVEGYMRRKLRRDVHPAFESLGDDTTPPAVDSSESRPRSSINGKGSTVGKQDSSTKRTNGDTDTGLDDIYRDALLERDRLQEAMEAYEQTTAGSRFKTDVTSKSLHSWEEVLEEVTRASETYNSRAMLWGKIRVSMRRLGDNSKVFQAWSVLLPAGSDCATMISGGLKLILSAAARLADLRQEVSDALAEIPSLLTCIHQALNIFKGSVNLHRSSVCLYVATLALLHHIVSWYKTKAIKKLGLSILRQGSYESQMSSLLSNLRAESERFDREARLCSYGSIEQTREISIQNQQTLNSSVSQWDRFQGEIRSDHASTRDGIHAIEDRVSDMHAILERFLGSHDRVDPHTLGARGPMLPSDSAAVERRAQQMYLRSRDHAFSTLSYTSSILEKDLTTNLQSVWQLPLPYQNRIMATMQTPKLQSWLTTPTSSALFLNLNSKATSPALALSACSFIPAKLIESISAQESGNIIILAFFCGAHVRNSPGSLSDPHSGPGGSIRSLIAQLLESHPRFDLQTVRRIPQVDENDIPGLCDIFYDLITQLPPDIVVFCIADAVSEFEDRLAMREGGETIVQALLNIVESCALGNQKGERCVFKVLLTAPGNSRRFWRCVEAVGAVGDVVWMPEKVPSLGGFTAGKWGNSVGGLFV
ncbi:hypothetical protein BJY04DRAFT_221967 [Aspergillus karnatakaensis]|uniref:uncharacterized protein n=1 Tax=Aspergillus karnatakaensis TaxID=1810916 RepID=UPI003CCE22E4